MTVYNMRRESVMTKRLIKGKENVKTAMNAVRNYQKELDKVLENLGTDRAPRLLLHSCCAPCSSYVLEYLRQYFQITVFYYNPNISLEEEYQKRVKEQKRLIASYNEQGKDEEKATAEKRYPIRILEGEYDPKEFLEMAKGMEECPEGGKRCFACYEMRLGKTARTAAEGNFEYFTTTLTISPLKNAIKLNEIGERLEKEYGVKWLVSDFKKRDGYKRSIELSKEYELYRQDYCGCVYSRRESDKIVEK